jgi:hypothetical protein
MVDVIKCIQRSFEVGDYIKFLSNNSDHHGLGEVIHSTGKGVKVKIFCPVDSAILQRFTLRPINPTDHPLAYNDQVVEVYKTLEEIYVDRCNIRDVVFIVPVSDVESGVFYLSGADNVFCIRYIMKNATMKA